MARLARQGTSWSPAAQPNGRWHIRWGFIRCFWFWSEALDIFRKLVFSTVHQQLLLHMLYWSRKKVLVPVPEKILGTVTLCLNGLLNYALVVANTNFHFIKPIFIPRQGDLFLYGTEALICPINRKGSWVGCLGWERGQARTFFLSSFLRSLIFR